MHRATVALATPLGTPLAGDTLFGHFCWALRESAGEAKLQRVLDGYTQGKPWLVVSDGFPAGFLPKPTLPRHFEPQVDTTGRKATKRQRWISMQCASLPLRELLAAAVDDEAAYGASPVLAVQAHNTINRRSGTTGKDSFAPYASTQHFHAEGQKVDIYLVIDDERVSTETVGQLLVAIGAAGYGRDASIGLGKFELAAMAPADLPLPMGANASMTLAPCAPQGLGFDGNRSYWRVLTRYGRHGNAHALAPNPFKTPVLLAATGAVFVPETAYEPREFIGQGLGGHGRLSKVEPETVQQGYAPVLPVAMEWSHA